MDQQEQEQEQEQEQDYVAPMPGIIVNIHKDWDSLVDLITHQPTFNTYRDHIDAVIDEVLDSQSNEALMNAELAIIEQAVLAPPNLPCVAQTFYSFRQGLLDFYQMLHGLEEDDFLVLSAQFEDYWPYTP